ncbi:MAG: hypothetical protein M5R36_17650 [Deltaproteobacteria bacterium]|nr:hypothetical protein [Deltaproteobacteria bacterium]
MFRRFVGIAIFAAMALAPAARADFDARFLLWDDFDNGISSNWTVVNNGGASTWTDHNACFATWYLPTLDYIYGGYAVVDNWCEDRGQLVDTDLISNTIDLTHYIHTVISFNYFVWDEFNFSMDADIYRWNGSMNTWTTFWTGDHTIESYNGFDVDDLADGQGPFRLRFRYDSSGGHAGLAALDEVAVFAECGQTMVGETQSEDDGAPERYISAQSAGDVFAVCLAPEEFPAFLTGVSFFLRQNAPGPSIRAHVWPNFGEDDPPRRFRSSPARTRSRTAACGRRGI